MRASFALLLAACAAVPPAPDRRLASPAAAIVQAGTPVLRARAREVDPRRIGTPELEALIDQMIAAMRAAPGVGLAAPQLGVGERVFVLEDRAELQAKLSPETRRERERAPFPIKVFINPVVRPVGHERLGFFEGCLSVRGYVGYVERHAEVEVTGLDRRGQPQAWRVRGWPARILQHELDHLDGTLYVDRMDPRGFSEAGLAARRHGQRPIAEIKAELGLGR